MSAETTKILREMALVRSAQIDPALKAKLLAEQELELKAAVDRALERATGAVQAPQGAAARPK